jgi:hypothetical protein
MLLLLVLLPFRAEAQNTVPQPESASTQGNLKPEQLEALVAPIALYPDTLLAQVLMASTYPLEVVQADRWAGENKDTKGDALKKALDVQDWDDSVKALLATPDVLTMMGKKLDWTQKLGDAVLAQEPDVMDAIQRLRSKAYAGERLKSTKEQTVKVNPEGSKQVIAIEPTDPQTVHVPYYDPAVVYGAWPYPEYPPYYYYPEDYYWPAGIIATGIAFGAGYGLWRWYGGGHCDWGGGRLGINRGAHVEHWRHNAHHRRGVAYNSARVSQRFTGSANRPTQLGGRGSDGKQVVKPGGDRGNSAQQRPAGGAKTGERGPGKQADKAKRPTQHKGQAKGSSQKKQQAKQSGQKNQVAKGKGPSKAKSPQRSAGGGSAQRRPQQRNVSRVHRQAPAASRGGGRSVGGRGGGGRGGGGGRRSDYRLKHSVALLGHLHNGIGYYRFAYRGEKGMFVGVMAQEVRSVVPAAVLSGRDGYLKVDYEKLCLKFQTFDRWVASGAEIPDGRCPAIGR